MKNNSGKNLKLNKPTVTIGIPAYNEGANIGFLLEDIFSQNTKSFRFDKIIIASDGSDDNTESVVKSFDNKLIILLNNKKREGQSKRQNQIINICKADILVLLNADVIISDDNFLEKITRPIIRGNADLTSNRLLSIAPKTFVEKMLQISLLFKNFIYEQYKSGNNVYTCHGAARAFSKKLYSSFNFKSSIAEDAYSYLYCIYKNFKYGYVKDATIFYRVPDNLYDHSKQSTRFFNSKKFLYNEFQKEFVDQEYNLPVSIIGKSLLKFGMEYPIQITLFIFVAAFMKINSLFVKKLSDTWSITKSSKILR